MTAISPQEFIDFTYMLAAVGFILALKWLSSPVSAMRGVLIGEIASGVAVVATLFDPQVTQYKWIIIVLIIGAGVGVPLGLVK
jgi:NAD(P) transhydrogenase subunit beta